MHQRLSSLIQKEQTTEPRTASFIRTPLLSSAGSKVWMGFRADELSTAQRKWQTREISNVSCTYLVVHFLMVALSSRT